MERFKAYRLSETPEKKIGAEFVDCTLDDLDPGEVVVGVDLGVSHHGGYSQVARVPAAWVTKLPPGMTLWEAMAFGTAGFTAGIAVERMEQNGLQPANGPVLVNGATGGVGSIALAALAKLGYRVVALTGKAAEAEWLKKLGASEVLLR